MKRKKVITALLFTIIIVLYVVKILVAKQYDTKGGEYESYQLESKRLRIENMNIHQEILQKTSLSYINDISRQGGFMDGTYYLLRR